MVLYSYTSFHWGYLTVVVGAGAAMMLAFISDFLAAYLRVLEARMDPQQMIGIGGMLWLKVALSYGCVGYIISDTGRNVHDYVFGGENTKQTEEFKSEMVFNYLLITLVGASLIIVSELLLLCTPTRRAGIVLQGRIVDSRKNWEMHPLRSLVEVIITFGATTLYYNTSKDMLLSLQLGTFCGALCISSSELLASASRPQFVTPPSPNGAVEMPADHWVKLIPVVVMVLYFFYHVYAAIIRAATLDMSSTFFMMITHDTLALSLSKFSAINVVISANVDEMNRARPLPVMLLFAYIGSGTFQWIFENMRSLEVTVLLATIAGIAFLCFADMLVLFKPTRWAGVILQDRFINVKYNWRKYPVRSFVEFGCFLGVIYGSHAIYHDLIVAVQVGTLSGMLVTLGGEQVRTCARALPLNEEVKLEVEKTQILPLPVMSLLGLVGAVAFNIIYTHLRRIEVAFVLATTSGVIFALVGDIDPAQVLTSSNEFNRGLKWVYLNADWIRKLNLPPLIREDGVEDSKLISFTSGDVAFNVFRHMPNKGSLGIIVTRTEDFTIERVEVPTGIYDMIQRDPFSFVAAETLSTLEVFSNWHLAMVAFTTMTLIFIGQFSSDLLRAYILPPMLKWWGVS
ncbi:hypothetical protein BBP00_00006075 [Phytophthora kernoviae]|uniref:Uncharacterized protein n=1 Tax=Phytophthora kernoviae TaxID=325452 RepID=A0A3F2RM27_9STRA|nr:hypothetical protein BBP00_00006075 [Phytophthora kernoviae]